MSKHEKIHVMNTSTSKACVAEYETPKTRVHAALKAKAAKMAAKGSSLTVMTLALAACGGDDNGTETVAPPNGTVLTLSRVDGVYSATSVQGFSLPKIASVATLTVADIASNAYNVKLDADGAGTLKFEFIDAKDVVTLQAGSTIDGFSTLKVTLGTLDATLATITGVTRVEGGLKLTLAQVREIPVIIINEAGDTVEIVVKSVAEATELATLLQDQTVQIFGAAEKVIVSAAEGSSVTTEQIASQIVSVASNVRPASEVPAAPADDGSTLTATTIAQVTALVATGLTLSNLTYTLDAGQQALWPQDLADVAGLAAIVAGSDNFDVTDVTVELSGAATTVADIAGLVATGLTLSNLTYTLDAGQQALGGEDLTNFTGLAAIVAGSANFAATDFTVKLNGTFVGSAQNYIIMGSDGADTITGGTGPSAINIITGGGGADTITGGTGLSAINIISGGAGADTITGGGDVNTIFGGDGDDTITIIGATGDSILMGGAGNDTITGGSGNDIIMGGDGNDTIVGGAGNDIITSGAGADTITPGAGFDTIVYNDVANEDPDIITTFTTAADGARFFAGADKLQFSAADLTSVAGFVAYSGVGEAINIGGDASAALLVAFVSGGGVQSATAAQASFLFNQTTGVLSFDADGTGGGAAIVIATLTGVSDLATADFTFIA